MTRKRVEKVLELKSFRKDVLEIELKRSLAELDNEREALRSLEGSLRKASDEFTERCDGGCIESIELELFQNYYMQMRKQLDQQRQRVDQKLAAFEEKKGVVIEAHREKRLLEILHEKVVTREVKEATLTEQKESDFDFLSRKSRR